MTMYTLTVSTAALGLGILSNARVTVKRKRAVVSDTFPSANLSSQETVTNASGIATILLAADDGTVFHEVRIYNSKDMVIYYKALIMPPQAVSLADLPVQDIISAAAADAAAAAAASLVLNIKKFNTYDEQMAYTGNYIDGQKCDVLGYDTISDGGFIQMYWSASSTAEHNKGTVRQPTAITGAGRWLAVDNKKATIVQFGAIANSSSDIGVIITTMNNAGIKEIIINNGDFRLTTTANISNTCKVVGNPNSKIIIDWETLGAAGKGFYVTADNTFIESVYFDVLAIPTARNNDGSAAAIVVNADNCMIENCRALTQPTFVYSYKSNCSITVKNCYATGMFDGLTFNSNDNHGVRIDGGEKCFVLNNYFKNFPQAILVGISTNNSHFSGNTAELCGNHCIYISSGEHNLINANIAIGKYTDIKARGDFNTITNNKVYGGILVATNRIADGTTSPIGDTSAFHACVISNNLVMCERIGAYALALENRTSYNCTIRNAVISNNSIFAKNTTDAMFYGIIVSGSGIENVAISGNTVNGALSDGIIVTTQPFVVANAKLISVSNNTVYNSGDNGIQVSGDQCVISNNSVFNSGATGSKDGLIFGSFTNTIVSNNTLNFSDGGSGSAIREGAGSDFNFISGNKYQNATGNIVTVGSGTIVGNQIIGSVSYNPPSIAAGASTSTTLTVTGAALGDFVDMISFSLDAQLINFSGYVSSANTVTVVLTNNTGGTIDLGNGTLRVIVNKR